METKNKKKCACSFACERKGVCCDCLHYHRRQNQLPACYFPVDAEKTGDRSIAYFLKLYNDGKINLK